LPAGEAPIDNYSFGRKSLDGSLEIEYGRQNASIASTFTAEE
jgi:hypothetical protein